jgi:hypothetical protein
MEQEIELQNKDEAIYFYNLLIKANSYKALKLEYANFSDDLFDYMILRNLINLPDEDFAFVYKNFIQKEKILNNSNSQYFILDDKVSIEKKLLLIKDEGVNCTDIANYALEKYYYIFNNSIILQAFIDSGLSSSFFDNVKFSVSSAVYPQKYLISAVTGGHKIDDPEIYKMLKILENNNFNIDPLLQLITPLVVTNLQSFELFTDNGFDIKKYIQPLDIIKNDKIALEIVKVLAENSQVIKCEYLMRLPLQEQTVFDTYSLIKNCGTYIFHVLQKIFPKEVLEDKLLKEYKDSSTISDSKGVIVNIKAPDHNGAFEVGDFKNIINQLKYDYHSFYTRTTIEKHYQKAMNEFFVKYNYSSLLSENNNVEINDLSGLEKIDFLFLNAHGSVYNNRHIIYNIVNLDLSYIRKDHCPKYNDVTLVKDMEHTGYSFLSDIFKQTKYICDIADKSNESNDSLLDSRSYTSDYLASLSASYGSNKPLNIILKSCTSQAALKDSIEVLPANSAIITSAEYRILKYSNILKKINSANKDGKNFYDNLKKVKDFTLDMYSILILMAKNSATNASPAFATKTKDGDIKIFSCIEKLEEYKEREKSSKMTSYDIKKFAEIFTNGEPDNYHLSISNYISNLLSGNEIYNENYNQICVSTVSSYRACHKMDLAFGCFLGLEDIYQ